MPTDIPLSATKAEDAEPELRDLRQRISRGLRARLALGAQLSIRTRHGQTLDVKWVMPLREGRSLVVSVGITLLLEARGDRLFVVPSVSERAYIERGGGDPSRWAPSDVTTRAEWSKFTVRVEQVLGEVFERGYP